MNTQSSHVSVIWRFTDNKAGHDSQSKGLVKALNHIQPFDCHNIDVTHSRPNLLDLLLKKYPAVKKLPSPDLIIGAGHDTHLPMLCAKRARGGTSIVIMTPSLPNSWFDCCFIPEHDSPKIADNILTTKGALNCIESSNEQSADRGLILIGGPSRHFAWDNEYLMQQVDSIAQQHQDIHWEVSDSPRTPEATSEALSKTNKSNIAFVSHTETGKEWLPRRLNIASNIWVSADSVSMIYESITSGAAVGLLDIPAKGESKLSKNIAGLVEEGMATPYNKWLQEKSLLRPPVELNEAKRCAEHIINSGLLH